MAVAFINSPRFRYLRYSRLHPLKLSTFTLTEELIRACGLFHGGAVDYVETPPCREEDILRFHTKEYLDVLKRANEGRYFKEASEYGFDFRDCPVFPGVYEWALLYSGGTMEGVRLVESGRYPAAFSIAGGLHHAARAKASGFCYLNDPVMAILYLVEKGYRVAYVDIDAHHCDAVQDAFYASAQVFTVSLHEDGRRLFPGTGFPEEIGTGAGEGYTLNIPFYPYATDEIFLEAFESMALPKIKKFNPHFLVSQAGVDTLHGDPLANLLLCGETYIRILQAQKALMKPWIVLGGGGYNRENVVRGWASATAAIAGVDLPKEIPPSFIDNFPDESVSDMSFSIPPFQAIVSGMKEKRRKQIQKRIDLARLEWEKTRGVLESQILPKIVPSQ